MSRMALGARGGVLRLRSVLAALNEDEVVACGGGVGKHGRIIRTRMETIGFDTGGWRAMERDGRRTVGGLDGSTVLTDGSREGGRREVAVHALAVEPAEVTALLLAGALGVLLCDSTEGRGGHVGHGLELGEGFHNTPLLLAEDMTGLAVSGGLRLGGGSGLSRLSLSTGLTLLVASCGFTGGLGSGLGHCLMNENFKLLDYKINHVS